MPIDCEKFVRAGVVELAQELVRTPSHPGLARQEEAAVAVLERYLLARGIAVERTEVAPGRPNLVARVTGARPGRTLVLCGHTDTVPLNAGDPGVGFSGEIRDGRLHGRGAVDMKGPLAAMAAALAVVAEAHALVAGELVLAAVVDEEMESLGAEALVRSGLAADAAIVGEPTGNRLALGHKGLEWLAVEFTGRAAHGGTPQVGVNAIAAAARFLVLVEERLLPRLAARAHPLLGAPTINAGTIRGGDQPSTVAAHCTVEFDRRTVPGETYASAVAELAELTAEVERQFPGLATRVRRVAGGMATLEHVALVLDPAHPLVEPARRAVRAVTGRAAETCAFPAWTDGALLSTFGGVPTLVLGPGDLAFAHSPRESVPVGELVDAAAIYCETALDFCDPTSRRPR
jgi:acetylornithine deacetylase/succinyl-diaminopimelate desuccinylase